MGCYNFLGVVEIIKGSIKILSNNGKIMASIATLGLLLNSVSFLIYFILIKPLYSNMNANYSSFLFGGGFAYLILYSRIALIINVSTVYASITSLCGHQIPLKNVTLRGLRSFKTFPRIPNRNLISWIMAIIAITTVSIVVAILAFPSIIFNIFLVLITIMVPTIIYIFYTSIVRVLATVILMIEENCDGSEALMKAEELIKGRWADCLVLNLVYNLLFVMLFVVYIIVANKWPSKELVTGLFSVCVVYLALMFLLISYTFLYFKAMERNGEEVKFDGKLEYSKIPAAPLVDKDIP